MIVEDVIRRINEGLPDDLQWVSDHGFGPLFSNAPLRGIWVRGNIELVLNDDLRWVAKLYGHQSYPSSTPLVALDDLCGKLDLTKRKAEELAQGIVYVKNALGEKDNTEETK